MYVLSRSKKRESSFPRLDMIIGGVTNGTVAELISRRKKVNGN